MCLCVRERVGAGFALNTHAFAYNKMSSHCCVFWFVCPVFRVYECVYANVCVCVLVITCSVC